MTISGADRLVDTPREELAQAIWRDVCRAAGLPAELPPWQIVRERRATFAATPAQNAKRPGPSHRPGKLSLAGDWTDTGLAGHHRKRGAFRLTAAADLVWRCGGLTAPQVRVATACF